ncbi:hypothetical protein TWF703_009087 [Orbilia oligospora]|uniref:Uncharacterized protein n=1 Tax=Orbilia oligospora TaxID=2813651 RepID=A0A7C8NUQ3_ORBOL|nr:hypothetical protein TWF703_009087 [Orbilia oligospora]
MLARGSGFIVLDVATRNEVRRFRVYCLFVSSLDFCPCDSGECRRLVTNRGTIIMPSDCSPSSFSDADSDSDPNADAVDADSDSDADSAPDSSELVRAHASPRYKHFPQGTKRVSRHAPQEIPNPNGYSVGIKTISGCRLITEASI